MAMVENGTTAGTGTDEFYAELHKVMDAFLDQGIVAKNKLRSSAKELSEYLYKRRKTILLCRRLCF